MDPVSNASASTLATPDAELYYEVRGSGPVVLLVGAPMDADAFAPLAALLAPDYTVITTDPRGSNRSTLRDPEQDSTPELRAADLSQILAAVTTSPATVVGSSGGAVSALALAQGHPDQVQTVIAHEPPLVEVLQDRDKRRAGTEEIIGAYVQLGRKAAWTKFMSEANIFLPEPVLDAMFGAELPSRQAADEDHFFRHQLLSTTRWVPDLEALRTGPCTVVIAVGQDSTGQLCDRTTDALAAALGADRTVFPGGHTGFLEHPEEFATTLRTVLPG